MSDTVIVGLLAFLGTALTSYFTNKKTIALLEYKLQQLTEKVEKHNTVIERTYELEERMSVAEERQKVANNRLSDLERAQNGK